jgi:hypothetical protein
LVMVNNNNNQQQSITTSNSMTTAPAPPIGQKGTASIIYMNRNIYAETLDLSQQTNLKIFHAERSTFRQIIFPIITDSEVNINIDGVFLELPLNTFPQNMSKFIFVYNNGPGLIDSNALSTALTSTNRLIEFGIYDSIFDNLHIPNLNFASLNGMQIGIYYSHNFAVDSCQGVLSSGNIVLSPDYDAWRGTSFAYLPNITTIGNLYAVFNVPYIGSPYTNYYTITVNNILLNVGNITLTGGLEIIINFNPMLQNIGRITIVNPANGMLGDFRLNNFSASVISQILIDYDATGATGGTLQFAGNPGTGTPAPATPGRIAYDSLIGKIWTINF